MLTREQRLEPEDASATELRTPFQRDRDRVLYSAQFRRLAGITQVETPALGHAFHNRMTHTLEVAQLARRLAERANIQVPGSERLIDPDVCEAAALAHDLGHPPFGHNGEAALDAVGAADGFEANAQSLRILLKLAARQPDSRGLNLTAATLRASVKYPWRRGENPDSPTKFGVYASESAEFARLRDGMPPMLPTIEAQIMDWADDVAYSTHDVYDFALAEAIPIADLQAMSIADLRELMRPTIAANASEEALKIAHGHIERLPPLSGGSVGSLRGWVSGLIGRFAGSEVEFVGDSARVELRKSQTVEDEIKVLKAITQLYAIDAPALAGRKRRERHILTQLYDAFRSSPDLLPDDEARARIESGEELSRVVLDVVGGMTDDQANSTYRSLTGAEPETLPHGAN